MHIVRYMGSNGDNGQCADYIVQDNYSFGIEFTYYYPRDSKPYDYGNMVALWRIKYKHTPKR